eukprot:5430-Heterococcus_DN1.PRE.1
MSMRSLWARVASHLQPQEVEVIRSLIGNQLVDENDSLWLEVDALEDVLRTVEIQNEQLLHACSTSSHTRLTDGPQRLLLEQNISLLLRRLDLTAAADNSASITDSGAAQCSATLSPLLTCPRDKVIYNYLTKGKAKRASSAGNLMLSARTGSRPQSRGTPRSARSAPDFLESAGSKLNVQHIDTVLTELQQAFTEEAEGLLEEVQELTELVQQAAESKVSAQNDLSHPATVTASDLQSFSRKLEQQVRLHDSRCSVKQ